VIAILGRTSDRGKMRKRCIFKALKGSRYLTQSLVLVRYEGDKVLPL
jgi:hypothetical protein